MKKRLFGGLCALMLLILYVPLPLEAQAATQRLGDLTIGSEVKIKENGVLTDFILIQHGYPTPGDGKELLLRKDAITTIAYHTNYIHGSNWTGYSFEGRSLFSNSNIHTYLNTGYLNTIEEIVKEHIIEVSIEQSYIYTNYEHISGEGMGPVSSMRKNSNYNAKIFVLSLTEMGHTPPALVDGGQFIGYFSNPNVFKSPSLKPWGTRGGAQGVNLDGFSSGNYTSAINATTGKMQQQNGCTTYYPVFCLPSDVSVATDGSIVIDADPPIISDIVVPAEWSKQIIIDIPATDADSGVAEYAISEVSTAPATGWQTSSKFNILANGTYYAFAKDGAGNISAPKEFVVDKLDADNPVIISAVASTTWGKTNTITVTAEDVGSGVAEYAISTSGVTPAAGWQESNVLTVSANGYYFVWARDAIGNTSAASTCAVSWVDDRGPVIQSITGSTQWAKTNTITFAAIDNETGIAGYAISTTAAPPSDGWQDEGHFVVNANGIYYLWAKDKVGNTNNPQSRTVDKVDNTAPKITAITEQEAYGTQSVICIEAADDQSGIATYAVSEETNPPETGWQGSNTFTLDRNGSYYAFVRDNVSNIASQSFAVTKVDATPPSIQIQFSEDNALMIVTATDNDSGVASITINASVFPGDHVEYPISEGLRYATVTATDNAGNQSTATVQRIPGWTAIINTIRIDQVQMLEDGSAEITASSDVEPVVGIWVNGEYIDGNPVIYPVPQGIKTLELQAQDTNGDQSELYIHRIPGFEEEIPSLTVMAVDFSPNFASAKITATETGNPENFKGIKGIQVNNDFLAGNPVDYTIPTGVKRLEARAINNEGDYSAPMVKRVPGSSEIVGTLKIEDVSFNSNYTEATITAVSEGAAAVSGIHVNGVLHTGNPVTYTIAPGIRELKLQAEDTDGDRSAIVTVTVPKKTVSSGGGEEYRSIPTVTIKPPMWTNEKSATVEIEAKDRYGILVVKAKAGSGLLWQDITKTGSITIKKDTIVRAYAVNDDGAETHTQLDIVCFDHQKPTVTSVQQGYTLQVSAADDKSGVAAIMINGKTYKGSAILSDSYTYSIPPGAVTVTVQAADNAGNLSELKSIAINAPPIIVPGIVEPKPPEPTPEPEPAPPYQPTPEATPRFEELQPMVDDAPPAAGRVNFMMLALGLAALVAAAGLVWVGLLICRRAAAGSDDTVQHTLFEDTTKALNAVNNVESIDADEVPESSQQADASPADVPVPDITDKAIKHIAIDFGNSIVADKFRRIGG